MFRGVENLRQQAEGRLEAPELQPLREYVRTEFDSIRQRLDSEDRCNGCIIGSSYERAKKSILELFGRLAQMNSVLVDIATSSDPNEVKVTLWLREHDSPERETTTSDTMENVYRGRYTAKAEKSGWKRAESSVNLLRESGHLTCVLRKADSAQDSYCNIEEGQ